MKRAFVLAALSLVAAACATPSPEPKAAPAAAPPLNPAAAKGECAPPPKELVVKDLQPGTGREVRFRSAVNVGYTGWIYDGCKPDFKGAEFDTTRNRSTPFGFMVGAGRVIKGWDEGLVGMKEKGKRMLIIPPGKGYGDRAAGPIPPGSTLVFEIDLAEIIYQPEAPR